MAGQILFSASKNVNKATYLFFVEPTHFLFQVI